MKTTVSVKTKKTQIAPVPVKKKVITRFRPRIRTRHPSHEPLRTELPLLPFRSIVRLGSETLEDTPNLIECNTPEAVRNSSSKLRMKQCFVRAGVKTPPFCSGTNIDQSTINQVGFRPLIVEDGCDILDFPLIIKSHMGSRGRGNSKIDNQEQLREFIANHDMRNYIIEQYRNFNREYRLHITEEGCFYTCRKMLKRDTPEDKRFQRHDDNCVWIVEDNPSFNKPVNWEAIVADCVKALKSLGLDIGAFDLKVQSEKDHNDNYRENPEWIVIESCSAPSFGNITTQKYIEQIPKILTRKFQEKK